MRSRSDPSTQRSRTRLIVITALVGAVLLPFASVAADVISTGQFVVLEGEIQDEDAYVVASSGNVVGTVDGDLIIATSRLTISGLVTGDVFVLSQGRVDVSGRIAGSLRGVARSVEVSGTVDDDIAVAALDLRLDGTVGRDVIVLANDADLTGSVERDVLGRTRHTSIDGAVGRDVDMTVDRITVGSSAVIGGDVVYKSTEDIVVRDGGQIGGQIIDIPARSRFYVGVVLTMVLLLGFVGFLVSGVVALWLFPSASQAAMEALLARPWLTGGVGAAAVAGVPLLIAILVATLVGIPLAVLLLLTVLVALVFGPVPVVTLAGARALQGRGGAAGGFLLGGTVWLLLVMLLPVFGAAVGIVVLTLGVGAWIVGGYRNRQEGRWPEVPVSR